MLVARTRNRHGQEDGREWLRVPPELVQWDYPQNNPLELRGLDENAGMRVVFWGFFSLPVSTIHSCLEFFTRKQS
jgi:hypothetical protein